ncbi:MAG: hypothetical protein Q9169_005081 [Polycauliona sp. 2 TL-2023]
MKGAKRQLPTAVHVAFSLSHLNRPERIVLSNSLDVLSVFGSTLVAKPHHPESKDITRRKRYMAIPDYFQDHFPYRPPVGIDGSLDPTGTKFGNCCEDQPWKALAGHPKGKLPIVDPATIYAWTVNAKYLLQAKGFDLKVHDEQRMPLCRNCEHWISSTGGDLTHFDTKEKDMVEPWKK